MRNELTLSLVYRLSCSSLTIQHVENLKKKKKKEQCNYVMSSNSWSSLKRGY